MLTEDFTFTGANGAGLAGKLERPAGRVGATAIYAHCFTCTKEISAARRIAARLARLGIATLRFDFAGLGKSEGEFRNTTFSSNVADIVAAAGALSDRIAPPSLLVGHSLGGAAILGAAGEIGSARAVATIGAPFDPGHVTHNFAPWVEEIRREGMAEVTLAGRKFMISEAFLDNLAEQGETQARRIATLGKALLVLHAPRDTVVGIENAGDIFGAAKHPKSFVTLDDADHLVSRAEDAEYAAEVIAAWAARYLPPAEPLDIPGEGVRVNEASPDGFLQDITASRGRTIIADEPKSVGGTDLGLTPYELVAAGLGACTSMTIRMYARRKGWPLTGVSVDVTHDKIHAADCEACETASGKIDVFRRAIRLEGDLDEDQRARMLEIADKCPVHRTLESEIRIETALI